MGRHSLEYPKDATNKVKRHGERGVYALEQIHGLVNASHFLHLSMNVPDSPFPATLPMIGQMGSFDRPSASLGDPLDLYLHGFVSGRMFQNARDSTVPVCVSVAHLDGLVLSLSAFNSSYNYRSAVLFGHASLVTDAEEKLYALELITDSVVPGRWAQSRQPPTSAELQSTSVLRVKIASGSLKARDGETGEDKHDMENEQARDSIWTGVVPVHHVFGEAVPSSYNRVKETPAYITDYAKELTKDNGEYAVNAIKAAKKE
ncbi:uncharacterized protein LMH87_009180 [Akanthomyces muscarius]|uniref:Flavin-nucleotide-binding protein n=1 Tax=Akanthomyces muscarius TaxID=2231603 RepID=A0A9W8UP43_AKAMU|nr:uncharacterized protein LMH87_009180 [Akanthomyces muscarius]KAJ4158664.1 hypothetical protein LMH87_009180 [Akanthomyces muscarius]